MNNADDMKSPTSHYLFGDLRGGEKFGVCCVRDFDGAWHVVVLLLSGACLVCGDARIPNTRDVPECVRRRYILKYKKWWRNHKAVLFFRIHVALLSRINRTRKKNTKQTIQDLARAGVTLHIHAYPHAHIHTYANTNTHALRKESERVTICVFVQ